MKLFGTLLVLGEAHGVSGPVVHQFVEVIRERAFPLMGRGRIWAQVLRSALTGDA